MAHYVVRMMRMMALGAVCSSVLCVGLFGLVFIGQALNAGDGMFAWILASSVILTAGFSGGLLIYADQPKRLGEKPEITRALIACGVVGGLVTWVIGNLPAVGGRIMAITGCEANEVPFCVGMYAVWTAAGVAVGIARRSAVTAVGAGVVSFTTAFVGIEFICEALARGAHSYERLLVVALVPGLLVGLSLGAALELFKPCGSVARKEPVSAD